jgi:DNA repair exonuclease SbcCD ATPase subunit
MNYTIAKIRLINFHNFVNETILVPDGGHLFLLGDNGSGKTTVLDAVHYVLTAGRSMEFNAAARVIGREKSGGRSVQGVVMRYNIETGAMNPNGGTSYAALELAGRGGRPVTLAIGLSTHTMEEAIERWGVIKEGPLEEIPFLIEESGGVRPRTRNELRAALNGSGFYTQIGGYEKELARRFYGKESTFEDVCRFLKTGKAYREIVAGTADYHVLFRQLLQEPERELFENVVAQLKSLEASRADLDNLRNKVAFLERLRALREEVGGLRVKEAACRWQSWSLSIKGFWAAHDRAAELAAAEERRRDGLLEDCRRLDGLIEATQQRANELNNTDAENLVGQEQTAKRECEAAAHALRQAQARLKSLQDSLDDATAALDASRAALKQHLKGFSQQLLKLNTELPFQTSALRLAIDDALRSDEPETGVAALPVAALRQEAEMQGRALDRLVQEDERNCGRLGRELGRLERDIAERTARGETIPELPADFVAAQQSVRDHLFAARPLYLGLEPASGVTPRDLAALEQVIGDAVLATWLPPAEEADKLRAVIFSDFAEHALAVAPTEATDDLRLSDWIKRYFDVAKSDPAALIVLQQQVEAKRGPFVDKFLDHQMLTFRMREQRLRDRPPRLLGAEVRRRELERELRALDKQLKEVERELKAAEKGLREHREEESRIIQFQTLLEAAAAEAQVRKDAIQGDLRQEVSARVALENGRSECTFLEERSQTLHARHEDLRIRLRSKGLEKLQQRIHAVRGELKKSQEERDRATRETGRAEEIIRQQQAIGASNQNKIRETSGALALAAGQLARLAAVDADAVGSFAAEQCAALPPDAASLLETANVAGREAAVKAEQIRGFAAGQEGIAFAFIYEEEANELTDRRARKLAEVLAGTAQELQEQETLINERTVTLFRQLIMHNLVEAMQFRVRRLNEMTRRIARLLKNRTFGSNRYAFTAVPQEQYRKIHDLVLDYSTLDPAIAEADLRHFIEDHAQEIMNTEVGEIPAILDYRNWFRYELKVMTEKEGGIVMDRRVKSVGSGGEQAVPNYLLILTIAHFLYDDEEIHLPVLLFDEAFYGIDAGRRDQLLSFTSDLGLQIFVASPDQDGVKREIPHSTSVLVVKDAQYNVHLYDYHWTSGPKEQNFLEPETLAPEVVAFGAERKQP